MEDVGKNLKQILQKRNYLQEYQQMVKQINENPDVQRFLKQHQAELTQADIEKSYSQLYEYIQQKEKFLANDPTMIAPGYEPKLQISHHVIEVTYSPTPELLKRKQLQQVNERIKTFYLPKMLREASLASFEITDGRSQAIQQAAQFIQQYEQKQSTFVKGLYLVGNFGVGKTYLLGAIAKKLAEDGYDSTLIHFPTFAVEMKQAIGKDTMIQLLNEIKTAPILMIDDIGADAMSSWIRDDVLGVILQYRMQEMLPTFFSSNFTMKELERHLTVTQKGDQEPIKAMRIMERIAYLSQEIMMIGQNRRNPSM
ncbi:primosomal protein DnaI [Enterococcus cecorum]|uniref:Primosomal protein DnaI n=2 Tax=Enterococcus TaxID=1350 RepID=A0A366SJ84_9ENTE|nr:primosomal protein DnaI [Enterococcus cecorum]RBR30763.1 primosomal protein DnaI [Enterococcus cecorum]RBR32729.1 primosomal protein DnaI [Enterococcus cecorum]RBR33096.1 primosomal protein DnaI [Enterococcus cecorum]RBR37405.1 primosomal protein DnaI [Enterococcus cecorum]RBR39189.1 primosomal protein DnaI [Enterococcus cecorum]